MKINFYDGLSKTMSFSLFLIFLLFCNFFFCFFMLLHSLQHSLRRNQIREQSLNSYWLLNHPVFLFTPFSNTDLQANSRLSILPLTVQLLCNLWDTMRLHWSPSASHPTLTQESKGFAQRRQVSYAYVSAQMLNLLPV